jgi:antitoxin (DNA-binding transcriptional repressor) of toxin-antitoxin stability system
MCNIPLVSWIATSYAKPSGQSYTNNPKSSSFSCAFTAKEERLCPKSAALEMRARIEERTRRKRSWNRGIIVNMATIHISEADAAGDFAGLMARIRAGVEVVIESEAHAVAVVRPASGEFRPRLLSESIALAKRHAQELGYEPRMNPEFAADLQEIIDSRRPWNPPSW